MFLCTTVRIGDGRRERGAGTWSADRLGIDHFEGRSYVGWHRHVTLAVLAQAFCTLLRLDPKAPAPA